MFLFNYANLVDPLLRGLRTLTVDFAGMRPGERALDVCCGTGAQVFECARHGIDAHGVDIDPDMLRMGVGDRHREVSGQVSFQLADATRLPFVDGAFDYVTISLALHDKTRLDRSRVVAEMGRVVKPGGTLVFTDYQVPLPLNPLTALARGVEYFAGGTHYAGFRDYLRSGTLGSLIEGRGLHPVESRVLLNGLVIMVKARRG